MTIGVIGAGTMGIGIAQVAAQNNHKVVLIDTNSEVLIKAKTSFENTLTKLVDKQKITEDQKSVLIDLLTYTSDFNALSACSLVIEAIVENLNVKHAVFTQIEAVVSQDCIIASNTSSLSIASIGSVLKNPSRVIGIHFFNPAIIMPLVEIIPAIQTDSETLQKSCEIIASWGKTIVKAKDTPGFIVNRVARPFYGEAFKIMEEGLADMATIDWALKEKGGFKMGPFELTDFIGHDVNYAVTESVFEAFYYDPRFKPSFTQKRHKEAGFYGRKSGRGYYNYAEGAEIIAPNQDSNLGYSIFERILVMLINEAIDAVFMNVASIEDIDLAMTKGVNYPKGLLKWADEIGLDMVLSKLEVLFTEYGEDRYRPNPLLRRMVKEGKSFF